MAEQIVKRLTDDFLDTNVKDYALYVIKNRSLPSIMDGQRMGSRKILFAAMTGQLKKKPKVKMVKLLGDAMNLEFHHGDVSLKNTAEQLGAKHVNAYSPLEVIGQTPSLRDNKVNTAARYLEVRTTPFLEWYKTDMNILQYNYEDGNKIEPKFLLPIVPITLLWRTNAPGFGFSFRSWSYNLDDIINAVMSSLIYGTCSGFNHVQLKPEIEGIKPQNMIYNESKDAWFNVGEYTIEGDTLRITDLPYHLSFDKFNEILDNLEETGYIASYMDKTTKGIIDYRIKFAPGRLKVLLNEKFKFFGKLQLYRKVPKLTLNVIDVDGQSIVNFDTPNDLVDGFVKRRLNVYNDKKTLQLRVLKEEIAELSERAKIVQAIVEDRLVVNKRKLEQIKSDLESLELSYEVFKKVTLDKLSQDEIDRIMREIGRKKEEHDYIERTPIQHMYINDLIEFKNRYSSIKDGLKPAKKLPEGVETF